MACDNRDLVLNHERRLYNHERTRNKALVAACSLGLVRVIRRLVLDYGAPVSSVPMKALPMSTLIQYYSNQRQEGRELTLYTAAVHGQVDAFRELLQLGATVDTSGIRSHGVEDLLGCVFTPNNDWALLHQFCNAGLDNKIDSQHGKEMVRPFLRVINAPGQHGKPPQGALQMLLSRYKGATINAANQSPLVAAIQQREYDSIPVLDILLGGGAWIDGPSRQSPPYGPTDVPIFAAVEVMATRGDTRLLEWCVKHGANINHREMVRGGFPGAHYHTTPALYYVTSFDFWTSSPWDPVVGLKLLLDRGAKMDFRPGEDRQPEPHTDDLSGEFSSASVGPLPDLLFKWGVSDLLSILSGRRMIEFLTQLQAQAGGIRAAETLSRCEIALRHRRREVNLGHETCAHFCGAKSDAMCGWGVLIKEIVLPAYELNSTQLLAQYIVYKARCVNRVEHLTRATIDILLEAGADINGPMADDGDRSTTLHQLCREVGRVWVEQPNGCGVLCTSAAHVWSFRLITFVWELGTDRGTITHDGRTAKDLLLKRLDPGRCEKLTRMADMLDPIS
ncbi:hypothetical protein BJX65DRAFT_301468 [Aspergillus insuetus]